MIDILEITKSEYIKTLKTEESMYHLKLMMMHCLEELNI